jgi:Flp pilus assembly pilin Flp
MDAATGEASRDRGASMVEYGLMLILVLVVAFLSIKFFGETIVALFETSSAVVDEAPGMQSE